MPAHGSIVVKIERNSGYLFIMAGDHSGLLRECRSKEGGALLGKLGDAVEEKRNFGIDVFGDCFILGKRSC